MHDHSSAEFSSDIQALLRDYFADLKQLSDLSHGADSQLLSSLFRKVHSIKGCAATAELQPIALIAHELENLIAALREGKLEMSSDAAAALAEAGSVMANLIVSPTTSGNIVTSTTNKLAALRNQDAVAFSTFSDDILRHLPTDISQSLTDSQKAEIGRQLKYGAQLLLLESSFAVADFDLQFIGLNENLEQLGHVISTYPSIAESSPKSINVRLLFTSRLQAEEIRKALASLSPQIEAVELEAKANVFGQPEVLNNEIDLSAASPVPLHDVLHRAQKIGQAVAATEGKEVEFHINGADVQLEASVAAKINEALVHLVRNAVAHGIETPSERIQAGKRSEGKIGLAVDRQQDSVRVRVIDDGRGIDPDRVCRAAVAIGLLREDKEVSLEECWRMIFVPGLSTAPGVGLVAGRGVGLDVVQTSIKAVGGEVVVFSEVGEGTVFELRFPLPTNRPSQSNDTA